MNKKEWLQEKVFVDEYGRVGVPMTVMSREDSFNKRKFTKNQINDLYKSYTGNSNVKNRIPNCS